MRSIPLWSSTWKACADLGGNPVIRVKRTYDPAAAGDGARFLVDRPWPRGIKKEDLPIEAWLIDVAPSQELRQWFGHDAARCDKYKHCYFIELKGKAEVLAPLREAARHGDVTLLCSARDREHNNVVALRDCLMGRRNSQRTRQ
jgi:uncharacterized protein YeaO (DUF488 family)